jgi:predicted TIM-barrel fold metal-dependent hydrolase
MKNCQPYKLLEERMNGQPTMRLPFIDAHVHLWDLTRPGYDWLRPPFREDVPGGSPESIANTYLLDDYLAEAQAWNVKGFVHVEAGAGSPAARSETQWLEEMAVATGMPNGIVASAALDDPNLDAILAFHASNSHVRGIRHIVNYHHESARTYSDRDLTQDDRWLSGYALLARYGLSFDLQAYPAQFIHLAAVAERYPDTPMIIDHIGMPVETDIDGRETWETGIAALAKLPNVSIKLSGAGFIHRPWSAASVEYYVLRMIDLFCPQRVHVATNFPTDRMFATMNYTLEQYEALLDQFSENDRRDMWGRNTNRVYRLELDL